MAPNTGTPHALLVEAASQKLLAQILAHASPTPITATTQ
jgi:hypothetical protein